MAQQPVISHPKAFAFQGVRGPIIPRDTPARRWFSKAHTDATELLGVLSFFICQGIPDHELDNYLSSVVPPSGWLLEEEWRKGESSTGRRSNISYGPHFSRLIRQYGRRPNGNQR